VKKSATVGGSDIEVWFARTSSQEEMQPVIDLVNGAKQGIVFLMFMPGKSPILDAIVNRQAQDDRLFVKGVVSTLDASEMDTAHVSLVTRGTKKIHEFKIVQPQGLNGIGKWAAEVSRAQFLSQVGFAIVHSKVIVIDPCGKKPAVVTGSHNFSISASTKNDENLVIVRGNAALAQAYALNIQSVFDHYNFRAIAAAMKAQGRDITGIMKDPKTWQESWFEGDKKNELNFWFGV
jgi:phosphatidylserine/phosphatidylglycerophosphate/cardiolipin synthase-like enzyme